MSGAEIFIISMILIGAALRMCGADRRKEQREARMKGEAAARARRARWEARHSTGEQAVKA